MGLSWSLSWTACVRGVCVTCASVVVRSFVRVVPGCSLHPCPHGALSRLAWRGAGRAVPGNRPFALLPLRRSASCLLFWASWGFPLSRFAVLLRGSRTGSPSASCPPAKPLGCEPPGKAGRKTPQAAPPMSQRVGIACGDGQGGPRHATAPRFTPRLSASSGHWRWLGRLQLPCRQGKSSLHWRFWRALARRLWRSGASLVKPHSNAPQLISFVGRSLCAALRLRCCKKVKP